MSANLKIARRLGHIKVVETKIAGDEEIPLRFNPYQCVCSHVKAGTIDECAVHWAQKLLPGSMH
jgi:hypothetical protein